MDVEGRPPSKRIARLNRLIELLDSRDNLVLRVIDPIALWTLHLAFAVEAWRRKSGPHLAQWLAVVGEMESLLSLAGYSYEHPSDPFPEFTDEAPCFEGEALAHPLIPETRGVRNDLRLDGHLRVLLVSGSNMSGKSTLLRTVGTNAILAMAGAPVRAGRLRISPLQVGASIRTLDSLQSGTSRFYAEIMRLRQLIELTKERTPLLFLLDELLHGTNSHDRRIGAEGVCGRCSPTKRSAWSRRTTWPWRRLPTGFRPTSPTCISRITSRTDASSSTTACDRASWNTATLWS